MVDLLDSLYDRNLYVYSLCLVGLHSKCLDGKVMEIHWSYACLFGRPWKFEQIVIGFLSLMLRDDHPLPSSAVLFFVESLNHDSLLVRNVCLCVHSVTIILINVCKESYTKRHLILASAIYFSGCDFSSEWHSKAAQETSQESCSESLRHI